MREYEVDFYKSWYSDKRWKDLLPYFTAGRNVQGRAFTRNYTIYWFTYAVTFSIVIYDHQHLSHSDAHSMNVSKYLKKKSC